MYEPSVHYTYGTATSTSIMYLVPGTYVYTTSARTVPQVQ